MKVREQTVVIDERRGVKMLSNKQQEELVIMYQNTGDEKCLEDLFGAYRSRIQGRAYNASLIFGIPDTDLESALMSALWTAAKKWTASKGVPFVKYVSMQFNYALDHEFQEHQRKNKNECPVDMIYSLNAASDFDLEIPAQDVADLIAEQDAAKRLYDYIASKKKVCADVAALKAQGYSSQKIAQLLNYAPENVKDLNQVQRMWADRRLKEARKPAEEYYYEVLGVKELPIRMSL